MNEPLMLGLAFYCGSLAMLRQQRIHLIVLTVLALGLCALAIAYDQWIPAGLFAIAAGAHLGALLNNFTSPPEVQRV